MSFAKTSEIVSKSYADTLAIGRTLGRKLAGGEVIELVGDLGSGKTVLVRGLAEGINSQDKVQSPSFTLSRIYHGRQALEIHHFDFHRLDDAGVVGQELAEVLANHKFIAVIEWAQIVKNTLPTERLQINLITESEESRELRFRAIGEKAQSLIETLK